MTFTQSQAEAVRYRGGSVLVAAGAGSGKTRVLTERVLEYMIPCSPEQEPIPINRFLIITFTRSAAAELRSRISDAIAKEVSRNPDSQYLRRQLVLCRDARIETIDAFCQKILRQHADRLGISPVFRILDAEKSSRLRETALERLLETEYEQRGESFLHLADRLGAGRDDTRLAEMILKTHSELQSHARPEQWIQAQIEQMQIDSRSVLDTVWGREQVSELRLLLDFWAGEMEHAISEMAAEPELFRAFSGSFSETAAAMRALSQELTRDWDAAINRLPIPFPRIVTPKASRGSALAEYCMDLRKTCRKDMKSLQTRTLNASSDILMQTWHSTIPDMITLLTLCTKLEEEFQKAKRRANGVDFSDMEHLCLQILTDQNGVQTPLAQEIAGEFEEIMVDEYQDVSRVQDAIFHAISREGKNLFLVGDVKQAIYRFRLADPTIFMEKSSRFGIRENTRGERLIHLQENFRSSREVLDAVNDVFTRVMSARTGDIDYSAEDALICGKQQDKEYDRPHLLILSRGEEPYTAEESSEGNCSAENVTGESGEQETRLSSAEAEAELVAEEILSLIQSGSIHADDGSERRIACRDIAILLRAANTDGKVFARALSAHGIPVVFGAGGEFFSSTEISILSSMIAVIDNPHRDIPLLALLRSPAFSFSEDSLSAIRAQCYQSDFYSALRLSDSPEVLQFLQVLKELREEAADLDPSQLISRIIERLDLYALCSAMPDSELRLRHLAEMQTMASEFRKTGEKGIHHFLRWLRYREQEGLEPQLGAEDENAVRILSVHKSKGLEFPVVFVCRLAKPFNTRDSNQAVLIHPRLGIASKFIDPERKIEYPTTAYTAIADKLRQETKSEEMRLLYVAMTRAKERLFLTACMKNPKEKISKAGSICHQGKIPAEYTSAVNAPVEWLLPSAAKGSAITVEIIDHLDGRKRTPEKAQRQTAEAAEKWLPYLERALRYKYPYSFAENLPSKLTATELKDRRDELPDPDAAVLYPAPARDVIHLPDLKQAGISQAERGTLVHLVLQHIEYDRTDKLEDIQAEIRRLCRQRFMTQEEAELINPAEIQRFFSSEVGKRIRQAEITQREFRFSLLIDASELLDNVPYGEEILLQGSVDCCFEEQNERGETELVIVDYKTDRVFVESDIKKRAEHYRAQLQAYATALTRITGKTVKEKTLYFLLPGISVTL